MQHISTTPFGRRPVTAAHLEHRKLAEAPAPAEAPDKWALLRDLGTARAAFGVSDRDIAVLGALVSFHPGRTLSDGEGTIVFPSNAALCERAHGMAESTLRRHLAALVGAGLLLRHDSPNGKRYAVRDTGGGLRGAFGFDLRPLLVRSEEIARAARAAREAEARLRRLRERAVLHLRDARKLLAYGRAEGLIEGCEALESETASAQRHLRRRLGAAELESLAEAMAGLAARVAARLEGSESEKMDGKDSENERHLQNSKTESHESEPCAEKQGAAPEPDTKRPEAPPPALPLALVLKACPEFCAYAPAEIHHWHELIALAQTLRPMLGISEDAWARALAGMGPAVASITLACILQKGSDIARPGGYLRALTDKAAAGAFSAGPMVMALLRSDTERAA